MARANLALLRYQSEDGEEYNSGEDDGEEEEDEEAEDENGANDEADTGNYPLRARRASSSD